MWLNSSMLSTLLSVFIPILLTGGGVYLLGVQALVAVCVSAWSGLITFILLYVSVQCIEFSRGCMQAKFFRPKVQQQLLQWEQLKKSQRNLSQASQLAAVGAPVHSICQKKFTAPVNACTLQKNSMVQWQWLLHSGRAHACAAKILRSWVQFQLSVLSSLSIPQYCVLNQVPQGGAALPCNGCLAVLLVA